VVLAMSERAIVLSSAPQVERLLARLKDRSIVLVGMMGAGKTSVGRRLAERLALPFVDADHEIEVAAGMSVSEIFETRGESDFRIGEAKVIARLLGGGRKVIATGGGAFMNGTTRANIAREAISVWLKADPDVLMRRVRKRANRPLLRTADPDATLRALLVQREPVYQLADVTVESRDIPQEQVVDALFAALADRLDQENRPT